MDLGAVVDPVVGRIHPAGADRAVSERDVTEQPPDRPWREHAPQCRPRVQLEPVLVGPSPGSGHAATSQLTIAVPVIDVVG